MAAADLTAPRLRELLDYDLDSGIFRWRKTRPKAAAGAVAGSKQRIGYVVIRLDGSLHYAHRLACLHVTGSWPENSIDHRDGDKGNNRWLNLRDVTHQANCENQHRAQGAAGLLGAVWNGRTKNWRSIITRDGKQITLGTYSTPDEAHAAYMEERERAAAGHPAQTPPPGRCFPGYQGQRVGI